MEHITNFLSSILGVLIDFFFQALSFIGYPRLWASIVLFAIVTRVFFIPSRISKQKTRFLKPLLNRELVEFDPNFFKKAPDKETKIAREMYKKEVYKKYKISNSPGCLIMLLQYPLLVALAYVVRHPQEFIPSLEPLATVSPEVNSFLGLSLAAEPMSSFQETGMFLYLIVPLFVMVSYFFQMFPSLKLARTPEQKLKTYFICVVFMLLLGWLSSSLPVALSLYWVTRDLTASIIDFFARKHLLKSKKFSALFTEYKEDLKARIQAASAPEEKVEPSNESETVEASEPDKKDTLSQETIDLVEQALTASASPEPEK